MYPGTIFNWYDLSDINTQNTATGTGVPLFLTASAFDRGPEDMRIVSGTSFYRLYGNQPDFEKYGQPAIQAARIIDAGGRLLIKRVVASNATLANVIIVGTLNVNLSAIPNNTGNAPESTNIPPRTLNEILGADTSTDTETTQKYDVVSNSTFKWSAVSVAGATDTDTIRRQAENLFVKGDLTAGTPDEDGVITITGTSDYPVFVVCDNGRGVSNKSIRIIPDYISSRHTSNFLYDAYIYDGTTILESITSSINPNAIMSGRNYTFTEFSSEQVKFFNVPNVYEDLVQAISDITNQSVETVLTEDLVYFKTNRRVNITGITLADDSIDINSEYGIELTNGTNGDFGDAPFGTEAYDKQLINFFNGTFDDSIFDLDEYKIGAVFDANYSVPVKAAIADLVTFREDCIFFRDLGIDVKSYYSIVEAVNNEKFIYNRFIADYLTNYQIYNPATGKRITVTCMYDFAPRMVSHFLNGAFRPTAGIANNFILDSAIPDTVNFVPRITPTVNQKSLLDDMRVNYAIFQEGQCVMQSLYTSQEPYTQLSYVNNVLAIQEVARAVRAACPKFRYTFGSGSDFSEYARQVSIVLNNFTNNFAELGFTYQQNSFYADQKIFYAVITFRFNNWVQSEIFDLYALPTDVTT
jgi:hypothetical protein